MIQVFYDEDLEQLPAGSVVYYSFYYDGNNHLLAEKFNDGKWYAGNTVEGFESVEPPTPCYLIYKDGRPVVQ